MSACVELGQRFVYRALRSDEDPSAGLQPPAPSSSQPMSIAQAIGEGSSTASCYIHTTGSVHVALDKYAHDRVAIIDLHALPEGLRVADGMREAESEFGSDSRAYRFARHDEEIVIDGRVPWSAIVAVVSADECKVRGKRLLSQGSLVANMDVARRRLSIREQVTFKLAGVSNYTEAVSRLQVGQIVCIQAEPDNAYDSNAIRVATSGDETIGYIPKSRVHEAKPLLVNGSAKARVVGLDEWSGPTGVRVVM